MSIEQEIRRQIEKNKGLKLEIGEINNHLSILEGMCRNDYKRQIEEAYQKGLTDGWNAAWKVALMTEDAAERIGVNISTSPAEAIAKLKAYEEQKEADEPIKVGDIVDWGGEKYIVTYIDDTDGCADLLFIETGSTCERISPDCFTRTGRHYDIDKILEEMKE